MAKYILAIDQGTTSSRAMIIDENLNISEWFTTNSLAIIAIS